MKVETGARDLLPSPIGGLRLGIGNRGEKGKMTGGTSAPSVALESPFPAPLSSHALAVE